MDNNTVLVVVIAVFALVFIVVALAFRKRIRGSIKSPIGGEMNFDASNPQPTPGAVIEDAKSHGGGILAEDMTGRGASVHRAEAQQDIKATSRKQEGGPDPKA
jgi:hypothetical protein